ncbi:DNA-binding transcriptional LysR family regulator [Actinoplanes lutulentus]|uniref:DNA-binding transcriptional LysR family regulator n=1 Tax=Actinoplanes lutulentus TaxID=1287878 RepID=A0A327Z989_9ACTN|nr:LysR family transcriptional regulator [Actinoplanes lutulentus]MBB2948712.1 DNA-binding transcriptional LysR family regulator [Actinoplanes lutulentus]RAK27917.1 DNA-binding transcriptional LysR family regulator [Actinoplanes lutulentus]
MSGRVSLDLLHSFLAVHRAGTLTHAAEVLGLSQPTVTAQLRTLETQLGQALFVRGARGVTPTPAADDLARRLDGPLDALAGVAGSLGSTPDHTLHLGGPAELMTARVLPALKTTIAAGISVRVRLGLADGLLADLAEGRLDVVVSAVRLRRAGVYAEPLYDEEFTLVGAPGTGKEQPLLSYAEDMPIIRRWWRHVLGAPPPRRAALVVPDLRALRAAALAGIGVTVLPRYLIAGDLRAGTLVELHPTDDPPINTLYLATRVAVLHAPHVAATRTALLAAARSW